MWLESILDLMVGEAAAEGGGGECLFMLSLSLSLSLFIDSHGTE